MRSRSHLQATAALTDRALSALRNLQRRTQTAHANEQLVM
jgi:hypothetical protein